MNLLDWVYPKRCLGCGKEGLYFCLECRKTIRHKGECLAYDGIMRIAIKAIKYRRNYDVIKEIIEVWKPRIREGVVVTSVPMWEAKKRARGFNQAEPIARTLAKKWGVGYLELLRRNRETKPMYGLSSQERLLNVQGAFGVCLKGELPAKIVLIDDVYTSGATTRECKAVLLKAGVRRVQVLTLAR